MEWPGGPIERMGMIQITGSAPAERMRRAAPARGRPAVRILSGAALTIALAAGAASTWAFAPRPAPVEPAVERGAQLSQGRCASCHAIALEARSPSHDAPQFRVLGRLYSRKDLARKLNDIAATGHFEMPPVSMREDEMSDIAAYIETLGAAAQRRKSVRSLHST